MKNWKYDKHIFIILIILLCFSCQTIAFSALSTTMNIDGVGYARMKTDVRITDVLLKNVNDATINYDEFSKNTISTGITLNNNTSYVVYTIEVSNYNSNSVGIYSISGLPEGLSYSISSDYMVGEDVLINGVGKTSFSLTISGAAGSYDFILDLDFRSRYSITYNGFSSKGYFPYIFEGETKKINFSEDVEEVAITVGGVEYSGYTLDDNILTLSNITGDVVVNKQVEAVLVSGSIKEVGSEVCIGEECFYIISNDGTNVAMIAKYNLYVGGSYDFDIFKWTAYGDEATGKQDSTMLGYVSGQSIRNGTTAFSSDTQKGTNYSDYSGSIVEGYVNAYKDALEGMGVTVQEARLITKDELTSEDIGCSAADWTCTTSEYAWIYSTSYWSGSAYDADYAWGVYSDGGFTGIYINYNGGDGDIGVRPVIEIAASDIKVPLIKFTIDGAEYNAEEGMTWGEWVNSNYNTSGYGVHEVGSGLVIAIDDWNQDGYKYRNSSIESALNSADGKIIGNELVVYKQTVLIAVYDYQEQEEDILANSSFGTSLPPSVAVVHLDDVINSNKHKNDSYGYGKSYGGSVATTTDLVAYDFILVYFD